MKIFVKTLSNTLALEVSSNDTVDSLRNEIVDKVDISDFRLVFAGRDLVSGNINEYNLENGSTINLLLRLKGGKGRGGGRSRSKPKPKTKAQIKRDRINKNVSGATALHSAAMLHHANLERQYVRDMIGLRGPAFSQALKRNQGKIEKSCRDKLNKKMAIEAARQDTTEVEGVGYDQLKSCISKSVKTMRNKHESIVAILDGNGRGYFKYGNYSHLGKNGDIFRKIIGNDRLAAFTLKPGTKMTIYPHTNFRGRVISWTNNTEKDMKVKKGQNGWNYGASSMKIEKVDIITDSMRKDRENQKQESVVAILDGRGRGQFKIGNYDHLGKNKDVYGKVIGNDKLAAFALKPGTRIVLYNSTRFRGRPTTFTNDTDKIMRRNKRDWRFGVSSMRLQKVPIKTTTPVETRATTIPVEERVSKPKSLGEKLKGSVPGIKDIKNLKNKTIDGKKEVHIDVKGNFNEMTQDEKTAALGEVAKKFKDSGQNVDSIQLLDADKKIIAHHDNTTGGYSGNTSVGYSGNIAGGYSGNTAEGFTGYQSISNFGGFVSSMTKHLSRSLYSRNWEHLTPENNNATIVASLADPNHTIVVHKADESLDNDLQKLLEDKNELTKQLAEMTSKQRTNEVRANNLQKQVDDNLLQYQTSVDNLKTKNDELLSRNTVLITEKNNKSRRDQTEIIKIKNNITDRINVINNKIKAYNRDKAIIRADYLKNLDLLNNNADTAIQNIRNKAGKIQRYKNLTKIALIIIKIVIVSIVLFLIYQGVRVLRK